MPKKYFISILLCIITFYVAYGQNTDLLNQRKNAGDDPPSFVQIKTDTIFDSKQLISLLILPKNYLSKFSIEFNYSEKDLYPTSSFAKSKNAIAAVNGGFFNMDSGGGVTYFEIDDSVINRKRDPELKWGIADNLMNGAIITKDDQGISIQAVKSQQFYESSTQESAVLVTGPLLLLNSEFVELANKKFVNDRHPRTCLGISKESIVFVTIDGRNKEAEGMSLPELQRFLHSIGCIDAINLDGGGSTTMWIKNKGIVNFPSDKSGERPVSNVLLIT